MSAHTEQISRIPYSLIQPGDNDRKHFDEAGLRELADSIAEHGLAQPSTVRKVGDIFQLVAGERRWRAIGLLGWEDMPCIVRELSDEQAAAIMLAENTGRKDLRPIEEAHGYQKRMERFGWTVKETAEKAGVSAAKVSGALTLLKLVPEAQEMVDRGDLPVTHGQYMAKLDAEKQRSALRLYNKGATDLPTFQSVVMNLVALDTEQGSLFSFEEIVIERVTAARDSLSSIPTTTNAPVVRYDMNQTGGEVIQNYIADLQSAGLSHEAAIVGNLFEVLLKYKWVKAPRVLTD